MRRHVLCALVLTAIGCSGAVDQASEQQELKLAAANAKSRGTAQGDACAQHRWYGDGVCDTFCADTDSDCVPKGDAIVCAQFIEQGNGKCERPASDACRFQDPDCTAPPNSPGTGGAPGSTPPGGVACALVSEVPNGSCDRADSDPCRFQDPDCNTGTVTPKADCDASKIVCKTFAAVVCPDGQVPSVVNGCYGPCVTEESCAVPPGSGGNTGSGGAPGQSGGSTGTAGTPTGSGGNTGGGAALYDCDPRNITCQTLVAVTCPDGQVPSVSNHCYGACVAKDKCAPIACLAYIEVSDGTCSRPANDPCRGQDPDCVDAK
jgi:hypothetical protein